jgi:hypothetical protein
VGSDEVKKGEGEWRWAGKKGWQGGEICFIKEEVER